MNVKISFTKEIGGLSIDELLDINVVEEDGIGVINLVDDERSVKKLNDIPVDKFIAFIKNKE